MTETADNIVAEYSRVPSSYMIEKAREHFEAAGVVAPDAVIRAAFIAMLRARDHEASFDRATAASDKFGSATINCRGATATDAFVEDMRKARDRAYAGIDTIRKALTQREASVTDLIRRIVREELAREREGTIPANLQERQIERPGIRVLPDGRVSRLDAATYLGRSPKTLADWASLGQGPMPRKVGGRVFYLLCDLDAWRDTGKMEANDCD